MVIPKKILAISLVVIAVAAGGYYLIVEKGILKKGGPEQGAGQAAPGSSEGAPASNPAAPAQKDEAAPMPVKAETAHTGDLVMTLKSPGEAYTEKKITMKAEVGGVVKNLYAKEGMHVKEGDILVELDDRESVLKLERYQAQRLKNLSDVFLEKQFAAADKEVPKAVLDKLDKAQAEYDRATAAFQKSLIVPAELERAQKDYELALIEAGRKKEEIMASTKNLTQSEIDVKIAQMDLAKTKIRAPFSGLVSDIKISPREHIDPGRELFLLVDISRIRVKAKVLESEVGKMRTGRDADLRFSAYPGKVFKGVVEAIAPVVDTADRTCTIYIGVSNPGEEIKPGMHAEVEIATEIFKDRLLVPQEAILTRSGRRLVFVVEEGLAKWRYVEIGMENEKFAEILDGVKDGEPVIVEGHFTLAHDARVSIEKTAP
jgi:RND family efflux transporter MFP subunit